MANIDFLTDTGVEISMAWECPEAHVEYRHMAYHDAHYHEPFETWTTDVATGLHEATCTICGIRSGWT